MTAALAFRPEHLVDIAPDPVVRLVPDLEAERPVRPAVTAEIGSEVFLQRRLVVAAVVLALVVGVVSFLGADGSSGAAGAVSGPQTVVVEPGDSLWAIAGRLAPGDPRPLVDELSRLVGGTDIRPGQRIHVPGELLG